MCRIEGDDRIQLHRTCGRTRALGFALVNPKRSGPWSGGGGHCCFGFVPPASWHPDFKGKRVTPPSVILAEFITGR